MSTIVPVKFFVLPQACGGTAAWNQTFFRSVLRRANDIWAQANIFLFAQVFRSPTLAELELPTGAVLDPFDNAAYTQLMNHFHRHSLRVLLSCGDPFGIDPRAGGISDIDGHFVVIRHFPSILGAGNVLAHEIGHSFGLSDRIDAGNLMNVTTNMGAVPSALLSIDAAQIDRVLRSRTVRTYGMT